MAAKEAKGSSSSSLKSKKGAESATNSQTELTTEVAQMKLHAERTATGNYTAEQRAKDLKIESYSLNFHGRVLIENATVELNFGRRYGLIGANGSGKSTFLESIAGKDIEIPKHVDVSRTFIRFYIDKGVGLLWSVRFWVHLHIQT